MTQPTDTGAGHGGQPLRLCDDHKCTPAHYENCPVCYGWGLEKEPTPYLFRSIHRPIVARQLADAPDWIPCPNCGGSPIGLPQ